MKIILTDGTVYYASRVSRNYDLSLEKYTINITIPKTDDVPEIETIVAQFNDNNLTTVVISREAGDITYNNQTIEYFSEDVFDTYEEFNIFLKTKEAVE